MSDSGINAKTYMVINCVFLRIHIRMMIRQIDYTDQK